jgi:hypothetical protein
MDQVGTRESLNRHQLANYPIARGYGVQQAARWAALNRRLWPAERRRRLQIRDPGEDSRSEIDACPGTNPGRGSGCSVGET